MKTQESHQHFYKELNSTTTLQSISNIAIFKPLPSSWYMITTDIVQSTKAIEKGQYKAVNMVGALSIIAILNINKSLDLPFVFGGDGAFLFIPNTILYEAKQSMLSIQKTAKEVYNLKLRVAVIPIHDIYQADKKIFISKYEVNKNYHQAIVKGNGLEYCEMLLKQSSEYIINESLKEGFSANIEGLECRWQAISTPKDQNLSILIKCFDDSYYEKVVEKIEQLLGTVQMRTPITQEKLQLSFSDTNLDIEAALYATNNVQRFCVRWKLKLINYIGKLLMQFNIGQWQFYKQRIVNTTDTEKFDNMLRMVVATTNEQRLMLENYLHHEHSMGNLVYGIHKSDSSLMTCLIFERHGKHIHFVDGSDGGYALAAIQLKQQLKEEG